MSEMCNLQIRINGQQAFFVSERIMSRYCGKLRKIIKQEKRRTQIRGSEIEIEIDDFPGGADGFEQIARFCYNNGSIDISVSNVSLLYCCAMFLDMSDRVFTHNLLHQTEVLLEGICYWSWYETLTGLKNCEPFICFALSCGLIQKLLSSLVAKIVHKTDATHVRSVSSSSSTSSPDTSLSFTSPSLLKSSSSKKAVCSWWYQDMTTLSPRIIEQFLRALGSYGSENNNLIVTKFLLHYLKNAHRSDGKGLGCCDVTEYAGLADTAVYGVVLMGKTTFSCRSLFWVLRITSGFGVSHDLRAKLERLIGGMLDQANLDDLLVCGGGNCNGVYDVNLVLRLVRLFARHHEKPSLEAMRRVGFLIDMYLIEIGPDPNLKTSKFLGVAESLPDHARSSFDQVYRAVDIYLQSHPWLSEEERSRVCRCLNYQKLSLEACKDLAKSPRIPPRIALQALASQHPAVQLRRLETESSGSEEKEDAKINNIDKMQWRVKEVEKMLSRTVNLGPQPSKILPRMC